jgi:hypothetical protein
VFDRADLAPSGLFRPLIYAACVMLRLSRVSRPKVPVGWASLNVAAERAGKREGRGAH